MTAVEDQCVWRQFLVDKQGTADKRPVINLKPQGPYVRGVHFKFENLKTVKDIARAGDWACKVDLKDAFLHVPLDEPARKFFRFWHRQKLYQWATLPFGYRDSPRTFQKLMLEAIRPLRKRGVRMALYLDDMLILGKSRLECLKNTLDLVERLLRLGFAINLGKSRLNPSQTVDFLGVTLDLQNMVSRCPEDKLKRFRKRVKNLMRRGKKGERISTHDLHSIVGTLQSLNDCIYPLRLHLNALIEDLRRSLTSLEGDTVLSELTMDDLNWWMVNISNVEWQVDAPAVRGPHDRSGRERPWGWVRCIR